MPSDATNVVHGVFEAWNRGDLEGWLEGFHAEIRGQAVLTGRLEGTEFHGIEGMRRWWADYHDAFDEVRLYADEVRDLGERVVVLGRFSYRGKASGIEQERAWGWVLWLREGRIVLVESYDDPADALAAADSQE